MSEARLKDLPRHERQAIMAKVTDDLDRFNRNQPLESQAAYAIGRRMALMFFVKCAGVGSVIGVVLGLAVIAATRLG